jgi:hypothetical protein
MFLAPCGTLLWPIVASILLRQLDLGLLLLLTPLHRFSRVSALVHLQCKTLKRVCIVGICAPADAGDGGGSETPRLYVSRKAACAMFGNIRCRLPPFAAAAAAAQKFPKIGALVHLICKEPKEFFLRICAPVAAAAAAGPLTTTPLTSDKSAWSPARGGSTPVRSQERAGCVC